MENVQILTSYVVLRFWKCGWPRREQPSARVLRVQGLGRVFSKVSVLLHILTKYQVTLQAFKKHDSVQNDFFRSFFCIVIPQTLVKRTPGRQEAEIICCCASRDWCGRSLFIQA